MYTQRFPKYKTKHVGFDWQSEPIPDYKLWQRGNHPTLLWTLKHMWTNLGYIHNYPVKAGYVAEAKDYVCSSAITYEDKSKGLLEIDLLPVLSSVEWQIL